MEGGLLILADAGDDFFGQSGDDAFGVGVGQHQNDMGHPGIDEGLQGSHGGIDVGVVDAHLGR